MYKFWSCRGGSMSHACMYIKEAPGWPVGQDSFLPLTKTRNGGRASACGYLHHTWDVQYFLVYTLLVPRPRFLLFSLFSLRNLGDGDPTRHTSLICFLCFLLSRRYAGPLYTIISSPSPIRSHIFYILTLAPAVTSRRYSWVRDKCHTLSDIPAAPGRRARWSCTGPTARSRTRTGCPCTSARRPCRSPRWC